MDYDDLDSVMFVEKRAFEFGWTRRIFRDCIAIGHECWIIEQAPYRSRLTLGHAILKITRSEGELLNIAVDPNWRRRGAGARLLNHTLRRARDRGVVRLLLEVRLSNYAAQSLYATTGFVRIGERKSYYETNDGAEDAHVMEARLDRYPTTSVSSTKEPMS